MNSQSTCPDLVNSSSFMADEDRSEGIVMVRTKKRRRPRKEAWGVEKLLQRVHSRRVFSPYLCVPKSLSVSAYKSPPSCRVRNTTIIDNIFVISGTATGVNPRTASQTV